MSYDLVIFDNAQVPVNHDDFIAWLHTATENTTDSDVNHLPCALKALYDELIESFPNEEELHCYLGKDIIFASFDYVHAQQAHTLLKQLAKKYRVGFYNASSARYELDVN